jgi:glycosyltransferase involved in cell wall biosynthesis
MKPWHGVDQLLEAFVAVHREYEDARLLLVGHGPKEPALRERAAHAGLGSAVLFAGQMAHHRVPGLLAHRPGRRSLPPRARLLFPIR